ncbi:MAG: Asp-tRNA(Asn)/Glu-tRNA(Gln) amidotransferase subunit GatA [Acidobacteriota bacterium]|nr:Asp-tRNA(Asn)/Glu-tRNA(Gln) amidotransferase subunit GatA [Acidobacteriota bacterium]
MAEITERTVRALARDIASGVESAAAVCEAFLDRIRVEEPRIGAFNTVVHERAMARARAIDAERGGSASLPLLGVPVAIKDNLCTAGVPTTASSRILRGFVPPYSATVISRLEAAGAVVIGKTNLDEFAMGSSTENSALGPTRNPHDPTRTPGGSSGGSAAAVAARMAAVALGSDTGGSIRQPAAFCGLVGVKPTYGRVSRYGLMAFASSLDQIGPLARTTEDAALVLQVIAGHDPYDATSSSELVPDYLASVDRGVGGLRIGIPRAFVVEGVDPEVQGVFGEALARWQAAGATVVDIALPHSGYAIPVYYLIATAEASSNLARYDGVRYGHRAVLGRDDGLSQMYDRTRDEGFGAEVKRRIMLGTYVLSAGYYDAFYLKAQQVRTLLRQDYEAAFQRCDVIAMPTTPTPAFKLGEKADDPIQMYLSDVFTVSANLTGLPAISVPAGRSSEGLPIGAHLTGRAFDEGTLLAAARVLEG